MAPNDETVSSEVMSSKPDDQPSVDVQGPVSAFTDTAAGAVDLAAETVTESSQTTAQAFDETRDRLRAIGDTVASAGSMFDPFKTAPQLFRPAVGGDTGQFSEVLAAVNAKALDAWRTNAESLYRHWQKLAGVKSLSEMIALNAEFARAQIETFSAQTREFSDLASQLTRGDHKPTGR